MGLRRLIARSIRIGLAFVAVLGVPSLSWAETPSPMQVGWVERVALYPGGFIVPAKVDTGAVSCSLHCANPTEYEKDGKKWIKFTIKDADGKDVTIDRRVVGTRRIKRHYGGHQMRLVIRMGVCLGSLYRETDVNLVDRTGFEYPMLIGRNFMGTDLVVNPSVKHSMEPACKVKKFEVNGIEPSQGKQFELTFGVPRGPVHESEILGILIRILQSLRHVLPSDISHAG